MNSIIQPWRKTLQQNTKQGPSQRCPLSTAQIRTKLSEWIEFWIVSLIKKGFGPLIIKRALFQIKLTNSQPKLNKGSITKTTKKQSHTVDQARPRALFWTSKMRWTASFHRSKPLINPKANHRLPRQLQTFQKLTKKRLTRICSRLTFRKDLSPLKKLTACNRIKVRMPSRPPRKPKKQSRSFSSAWSRLTGLRSSARGRGLTQKCVKMRTEALLWFPLGLCRWTTNWVTMSIKGFRRFLKKRSHHSRSLRTKKGMMKLFLRIQTILDLHSMSHRKREDERRRMTNFTFNAL